MNLFLNDLVVIIPEVFFFFFSIILLMVGSFSKKNSAKVVVYFSVLTLITISFLEIVLPWNNELIFNQNMYIFLKL